MVRSVLAFDAFFRVQIIDGSLDGGCMDAKLLLKRCHYLSLARKVMYIQTQVVSLAHKGLGASNCLISRLYLQVTFLLLQYISGSQAIIHHK